MHVRLLTSGAMKVEQKGDKEKPWETLTSLDGSGKGPAERAPSQSEVEERREKTVMGWSEWSVVQILLGGRGRGLTCFLKSEMLSKND